MKPLAVHHVAVAVRDLDEAREFYADVLGLTPRTDRPTDIVPGYWLDAGGQQLHLVHNDTPKAVGQHFALLVDDLDGVRRELTARGIVVSEPVGIGAARQAFLKDPSGNGIELHEAAPAG